MALTPNDRAVFHRLLLSRADSVVSLCDLLAGSVDSDEEFAAIRAARTHAASTLELVKEVTIDGVPSQTRLPLY